MGAVAGASGGPNNRHESHSMTYYQSTDDGSVMELNANPGQGYTKLTKAEGQRLQREHARAQLRKILKPGDTVNCILRHCSRSGMMRHISLLKGDEEITYYVALAMDEKRADDGSIKVSGCGMDMGFHLVYNLGRILFPDGFGVKSVGGIRPTSKEHAQQLVADGKTTFRGRNFDTSGWDNDGGYALKHRWL